MILSPNVSYYRDPTEWKTERFEKDFYQAFDALRNIRTNEPLVYHSIRRQMAEELCRDLAIENIYRDCMLSVKSMFERAMDARTSDNCKLDMFIRLVPTNAKKIYKICRFWMDAYKQNPRGPHAGKIMHGFEELDWYFYRKYKGEFAGCFICLFVNAQKHIYSMIVQQNMQGKIQRKLNLPPLISKLPTTKVAIDEPDPRQYEAAKLLQDMTADSFMMPSMDKTYPVMDKTYPSVDKSYPKSTPIQPPSQPSPESSPKPQLRAPPESLVEWQNPPPVAENMLNRCLFGAGPAQQEQHDGYPKVIRGLLASSFRIRDVKLVVKIVSGYQIYFYLGNTMMAVGTYFAKGTQLNEKIKLGQDSIEIYFDTNATPTISTAPGFEVGTQLINVPLDTETPFLVTIFRELSTTPFVHPC